MLDIPIRSAPGPSPVVSLRGPDGASLFVMAEMTEGHIRLRVSRRDRAPDEDDLDSVRAMYFGADLSVSPAAPSVALSRELDKHSRSLWHRIGG
jgi:hypothetical protein